MPPRANAARKLSQSPRAPKKSSKAPKVRERFEVDARRAQLLALGLVAFSERTYDDVSIEDIATTAGVSKGLVYHYFPSKRDFYIAALEDAAGKPFGLTKNPPGLPPRSRFP